MPEPNMIQFLKFDPIRITQECSCFADIADL